MSSLARSRIATTMRGPARSRITKPRTHRRLTRTSCSKGFGACTARIDSERAACRTLWRRDLRALEHCHPDMFSSRKARLQERGRINPGECAYRGIGSTVENCLGLRTVYDTYFKPRMKIQGRGGAEFKHTATAVSQFLRWAVSSSSLLKTDIWKENVLFECVGNKGLVSRFMDYFIRRCSPSTVRTKAQCLKRVCEVAIAEVSDIHMKARLELTFVLLSNIANAARKAHRVACQEKKRIQSRIASRRLISSKNLMDFTHSAQSTLDLVMEKFVSERSLTDGTARAESIKLLVEHWCTHIVCFLVLSAGGQRPQVFCQLQMPTEHEQHDIFNSRESKNYMELRTLMEKRPRDMNLPEVVFPASLVPYIRFHIKVVRPLVVRTAGKHYSPSNRSLLLHPSTGRSFEPTEITRILRRFAGSQNPALSRITTMDLRSSYATMMLKLFRNRSIFQGLTTAEFLKKLAQQMNTSPEQLRRTYIAHNPCDAAQSVRALTKLWESCLV